MSPDLWFRVVVEPVRERAVFCTIVFFLGAPQNHSCPEMDGADFFSRGKSRDVSLMQVVACGLPGKVFGVKVGHTFGGLFLIV